MMNMNPNNFHRMAEAILPELTDVSGLSIADIAADLSSVSSYLENNMKDSGLVIAPSTKPFQNLLEAKGLPPLEGKTIVVIDRYTIKVYPDEGRNRTIFSSRSAGK